MIPVKDAAVLARMTDASLRRVWRQRIVDHDGDGPGDGGIERWLKLAEGVGFDRDYVLSTNGILNATKFSVEAYVHFVRERSLLEAIASSLTEMFSPTIISERVAGMLKNYDFITTDTLAYFEKRMTQAPRDADFALDYVKQHATTPALQRQAMDALIFKCNVLWTQLDALYFAYVAPGMVPPDAWTPGTGLVPETQPATTGAAGTGKGAAGTGKDRGPPRARACRAAFACASTMCARSTSCWRPSAPSISTTTRWRCSPSWTGSAPSSDIARRLAETFAADPAIIEADILTMLNDLATKRVLER